MKWWLIIVFWLVFFLINICIAELNDRIRRKRIAKGNLRQIEHFWWGLGYGLLCAIPFYISRNYWQLFSLLLLHLNVFSVSYNIFADLPGFHLSLSTKAITDRIMRWVGLKSIEEVAIISFCISLCFLMFQLFKL